MPQSILPVVAESVRTLELPLQLALPQRVHEDNRGDVQGFRRKPKICAGFTQVFQGFVQDS